MMPVYTNTRRTGSTHNRKETRTQSRAPADETASSRRPEDFAVDRTVTGQRKTTKSTYVQMQPATNKLLFGRRGSNLIKYQADPKYASLIYDI